MPTRQVTLTGTAQKIVEANPQRTSLSLANRDDTDAAHISDDQGPGITRDNSWPIFGETHISIVRRDGEEPEKAYWGICEGGKTVVIAIMEQFGEGIAPYEPSPQEPYAPGDAPLMGRRT